MLLPGPRSGFPAGLTVVTSASGASPVAVPDLKIDFGLVTLRSGEVLTETHASESVWVLLRGAAEIDFDGTRTTVRRGSLFDEPPTALHLGPDTPVVLRTLAVDTEWAIVRTANERHFAPRLFLPADLTPEYRGAGLVQNAGLRNVRLIFDRAARPESNLVLGEVVNFPGRWSSYPPHHHDQPEIYHYRFTAPNGYGHAELGDDVVKVRGGDTVIIPPGRDHAQVSAPGYGMYYLWIIRHLPGNPYTGFTFAEEHKWTLDPAQQGWCPKNLPTGLV
ncbi:MAG: 5-deoxy-glucuronate isomerase [Opitutus sp.]|nr:5-deoxy-glucuronate isomerase [Opitutus sp.]